MWKWLPLGEALHATKKRLELIELVANFLKNLSSTEIRPGVGLILGNLFSDNQGLKLEVSVATFDKILKELTGKKEYNYMVSGAVDFGEEVEQVMKEAHIKPVGPPLFLLDVYQALKEIAEEKGPGSRKKKEAILKGLLLRATPLEAKYIAKNVVREMRYGVSEGIVLEGIGKASETAKDQIERAYMFSGNLSRVAFIALTEGKVGIARVSPEIFVPLKPMLAQVASSVEEAYSYHRGKVALEYKLDGARVQIHKDREKVQIFSRHLKDITLSLPEIGQEVRKNLAAERVIIEGEVIALSNDRRPLPFQYLMRRFRRLHDIEKLKKEIPVKLYLFDLLWINGESLVDKPNCDRWRRLEKISRGIGLVKRNLPQTIKEGEEFLKEAYQDGHEGLMVKSLESRYTPGKRGKSWFKIKPTLTLDLVILAADWGYGRRHSWLSNYHLGARQESTERFLPLGKTFKGLTDEEFRWMTQRLLKIKTKAVGSTVFVRPEVVVEVAFNEIQKSSLYESGFALRFARATRIREDKNPQDADSIKTVARLYQKQFQFKGKKE